MHEDKFWMVYGGYKSNPKKVHLSEQDAIDEASRLAVSNGEKFYILKCVKVVKLATPPIVIEEVR